MFLYMYKNFTNSVNDLIILSVLASRGVSCYCSLSKALQNEDFHKSHAKGTADTRLQDGQVKRPPPDSILH